MINWIKSLFNKNTEIGCVTKHILQDLENLPIDKWTISFRHGTKYYINFDLKYKISIFDWDGTEIVYINGDSVDVTSHEFKQIKNRMYSIEKEFNSINSKKQEIAKVNRLKSVFPECFN